MDSVLGVSYYDSNECKYSHMYFQLNEGRKAAAAARALSKRSDHFAQVWRCKGYYADGKFCEIEATNAGIYVNGRKQR